MVKKQPNKQFNLTTPGSLPVRIGTYQRRRMYDRFLIETKIGIEDTILDVGVAADVTYESSNYLEQVCAQTCDHRDRHRRRRIP